MRKETLTGSRHAIEELLGVDAQGIRAVDADAAVTDCRVMVSCYMDAGGERGVTFRTGRNSRPSGTSIHIFGAVKEKQHKTTRAVVYCILGVRLPPAFSCLILIRPWIRPSAVLMLARRVTSAQRGPCVYRQPGFFVQRCPLVAVPSTHSSRQHPSLLLIRFVFPLFTCA